MPDLTAVLPHLDGYYENPNGYFAYQLKPILPLKSERGCYCINYLALDNKSGQPSKRTNVGYSSKIFRREEQHRTDPKKQVLDFRVIQRFNLLPKAVDTKLQCHYSAMMDDLVERGTHPFIQHLFHSIRYRAGECLGFKPAIMNLMIEGSIQEDCDFASTLELAAFDVGHDDLMYKIRDEVGMDISQELMKFYVGKDNAAEASSGDSTEASSDSSSNSGWDRETMVQFLIALGLDPEAIMSWPTGRLEKLSNKVLITTFLVGENKHSDTFKDPGFPNVETVEQAFSTDFSLEAFDEAWNRLCAKVSSFLNSPNGKKFFLLDTNNILFQHFKTTLSEFAATNCTAILRTWGAALTMVDISDAFYYAELGCAAFDHFPTPERMSYLVAAAMFREFVTGEGINPLLQNDLAKSGLDPEYAASRRARNNREKECDRPVTPDLFQDTPKVQPPAGKRTTCGRGIFPGDFPVYEEFCREGIVTRTESKPSKRKLSESKKGTSDKYPQYSIWQKGKKCINDEGTSTYTLVELRWTIQK